MAGPAGLMDLLAALGIIMLEITIGFLVVQMRYIPEKAIGGIG